MPSDVPFPEKVLPVSFMRKAYDLLNESEYLNTFVDGVAIALIALGYDLSDANYAAICLSLDRKQLYDDPDIRSDERELLKDISDHDNY